MANNFDISGSKDKTFTDLDIKLSSSEAFESSSPAEISATDVRRARAQEMAKQIAMNIGFGNDDQNTDNHDSVQGSNEATRVTEMATRPASRTSSGAQRPTSQRTGAQRPASGQRRPAQSGSPRTANGQRRPAPQNAARRPASSRPAQPANRRRRKKKSSGGKTAAFFLIGLLVLVIGMGYFIGLVLTNGAFLPNTTINGVDVGGMNLQEATEAVDNSDIATTLVLTQEDGSVAYSILLDEFGYTYNTDEQIQKLYSGIDRKTWFTSLFKTTEYKLEASLSYDEPKLKQRLQNIKWAVIEPQNAFITNSGGNYQIVDAVDGNEVDAEGLVNHILEEVRKGKLKVTISDYYSVRKAEIQSADLQEKLKFYQQFKDFTITIDFDYTQEKLSMDDYLSWLEFKDDGTYSVKHDEVAHYVSYLADTYDTYGTTRNFHATLQGNIRVEQGPQGTYGWLIDKDKTTEKIKKLLLEGKSTTIDPVYATRLDKYGVAFFTYKSDESARSAETDIGNTYIEVDLTAQKMWYYENGVCKFQTDQIVTGLASDPKRITPEGVYEILERKSPDYLSGDGYSDVYVKYFIRVSYEGIGFHDLSRGRYGGNTYLTNGSHGCINMKLAEVEKLYGMVKGGTPVIMYY